MKGKLVELIRNAKSAMFAENLNCDIAKNYFIAEFLIANGVTVQDRLEEKQATSDKTSEWISVKDRLPESDVQVLVACEMRGQHFRKRYVWYEIIKNLDDFNSIVIDGFITHWMPLPEPPKGE